MSASLIKRIICIALIVALGAGGIAGYNYYLENEESLEVLSPVQPPISEETKENISKQPVEFSHTDTFYNTNIEVELTADPDAKIYYTTDGSVPTAKSDRYKNPIKIKSGSKVTATTIKAIAIKDGEASEVITKSYVTGKNVFDRFSDDTYVFVLSADPYDLYDYENGIAIEGKIRDEWLATEYDGFSEINPNHPANWNQPGMAGERPMYVEVYDSKGNQLLTQAAGARVSGGYSKGVDQKSWKLIARTMYSPNDGMFKYPFFDNATDEKGALLAKYDRIVLRNGANDREFAGVRDELSMELARQSGFPDTQGTAPCAVFLNGEYYGYAWLHQNYCKGYFESVYGGNKDNYEVVGKAEGDLDEDETSMAVSDYNELLALCEDGLTEEEYKTLCDNIDMDNYIHYLAMQLFIDNRDWPGNNYKAWRYVADEGEEVTSPYLDGKWRYLFYDAEFAWGLYSDGYRNATLSKLLNGTHPAGQSALINALMEREDVRHQLACQMSDLIGGAFSTDNILKVLEEKIEISDPEQMYALKNGITSTWAHEGTFENSRNEIRDFATYRPRIIMRDIQKVCGFGDEKYTVNLKGAEGIRVQLNTQSGIGDNASLTAEYFNECEVKISAEDMNGGKFSCWEINGEKITDREVTLNSSMAKEGVIEIKAVSEKAPAEQRLIIGEVYTGSNADWLTLYNPSEVELSTKELYLTDDEAILNRYKIPTTTVKPGESLVIVCKNNKASDTLMKLQTNFSLKTGESLILSDSEGGIYSKVVIADCEENQSQQIQDDGSYIIDRVNEY